MADCRVFIVLAFFFSLSFEIFFFLLLFIQVDYKKHEQGFTITSESLPTKLGFFWGPQFAVGPFRHLDGGWGGCDIFALPTVRNLGGGAKKKI
jgi:hypothetical protein